MVNIPIDEFKEKWFLKEGKGEVFTNGYLEGTINYEDDNFMVIKLTR